MSGRYEKLLHAECPAHRQDAFAAKHPPMPREKRAKLFAPFDALAGYTDALSEQEIIYHERPLLNEARQQELDEKLQHLWRLYQERRRGCKYRGGTAAGKAFVPLAVTVTWFEEMPGHGRRGLLRTATGAVVGMELTQGRLVLRLGVGAEMEEVVVRIWDVVEYGGEACNGVCDFTS